MKNYIHIAKKIYHEPWLILPTVHSNIRSVFESHISGTKAELELDDTKEDTSIDVIGKTAIVPVFGVIGHHLSMLETMCGGVDLLGLKSQLKTIAENPEVENIVLYINSPGGTVTHVRETADYIRELSKTKNIIAFTDSLIASAAYWLASACNYIVATPSSELGSIGVYQLLLNEERALEQEGLKVEAIYSGKFKLMGASFRPLSDEERAMLQTEVDAIHAQFKAAVTDKRNVADGDMQGQVLNGDNAVLQGLADSLVNDLDELLQLLN